MPVAKDKNPEAYDELKKRLLNEYKKLVTNKKDDQQSLQPVSIKPSFSLVSESPTMSAAQSTA